MFLSGGSSSGIVFCGPTGNEKTIPLGSWSALVFYGNLLGDSGIGASRDRRVEVMQTLTSDATSGTLRMWK
jgi:hypothetical protein